jgi:hypothetical protein
MPARSSNSQHDPDWNRLITIASPIPASEVLMLRTQEHGHEDVCEVRGEPDVRRGELYGIVSPDESHFQ